MATDREVQELLAAGDVRGAATAALETHGRDLVGYLRTLLRSEDEAKEAFSVVAEHLWQGLPRFRFDSALRTWAYRLAWNTAFNMREEAWRRRVRPFVSGELSAVAEEIRTATAVRLDRHDRQLDLLRRELSEEERSILVLRVDKGLSWQEVASVMAAEGAPVDAGTVAKRFERLKARLAERARALGMVE